MKQKVLTDVELRARWKVESGGEYHVEQGTVLTPAARDFLRERNIRLCVDEGTPAYKTMTVEPIPLRDGKPKYIDDRTGEELARKGEGMTHLRGNLLVPKTHPRIAFRGALDSLMARWLLVQLTAQEEGKSALVYDLEERLQYLRRLLAAEVRETPLEPMRLLGMDSAGLRRTSHCVRETIGIDHPVPSCSMGRLPLELNLLRTQVREAELAAAEAFTEDGRCCREDILEALNRLSSCVYILFCRELAGHYHREEAR